MICESDSTSTTADRRDVGPGRYYVIVEPTTADATDYTLSVTFTDPPVRIPGDVCSIPLDLTPAAIPGMGSQTVDVSRLDPMLDARPSCGPTVGRDAMFTFTLPATQDATITVNGTGTIYGALETMCGTTPAVPPGGCWSSATPLTRNFRSLPAGTYYFVAETTSTTGSMSATLDVRAPTPIPMNDHCPGIVLPVTGASRRDTTIGFTNDVNVSACSAGGTSYPDAFYEFTLTTRSRVVANLSRDSGGAIYAAIQATCGATTTLACGTSAGTTNALSATLDPGTYYLVVETPTASTSDFTLDFFTFAM